MFLTHSSVAYISASAELLAVIFCLLDDHDTGPLAIIIRCPEIDLDWNSSYLLCRVRSVGLLWSCGPQFASVSAVGRDGLSGKLRWASMELSGCCWKRIPRVDVPFRYFITRFATSMCCCEGLA